MNKAFLIFSGYNQRAVIAFCRVATKLNVPFHIIASSTEDTILMTDYKDRVQAIRQEKLLEILDIEQCLTEVRSKDPDADLVILPNSEFLNRFFLKHRLHFISKGCILPLCEESLYIRISDKYSFGEMCRNFKLKVPSEFEFSAAIEPPFVAKPKSYFSSDKTPSPYLILCKQDWKDFLKNENVEDFYLQEFVAGKSMYLLFFISQKGHTVQYSQENLVQQAKGKSIILAKSATIHENKIASIYLDMLLQEGFEGLIMIELKQSGDTFHMIEANPRLWGPSQLFVDAGVPIFEEFIRSQGFNIEIQPSEIKESIYFWQGGISEDKRNGRALAFHDFSSEKLDSQLNELVKSEVYNRSDTERIYHTEN
ncbi:MAG TPA: hypothetical protein VFP20_03840 [Bacteroidales bacterium]|nr:hypothetical protein [Bacteroidales bacterium]